MPFTLSCDQVMQKIFDGRVVDLTVTFSSLFSNYRDVRKRASGVPERVLADESGRDLQTLV
jgi:hypothetical protein